jgi:hypothetical protein
VKPDLLPIRFLASGEQLQLPLYRFVGASDAPNAYLQASLHGSEVHAVRVHEGTELGKSIVNFSPL